MSLQEQINHAMLVAYGGAAAVFEHKESLRPHENNRYSALTVPVGRMDRYVNKVMLALHNLEDNGVHYDAIAVTGTSGLSVAMILYYKGLVKKPLLYVRRPDEHEQAHGRRVEVIGGTEQHVGTNRELAKYPFAVFLDDCVCSGRTRKRVQQGLSYYGTKLIDERFDILYTH